MSIANGYAKEAALGGENAIVVGGENTVERGECREEAIAKSLLQFGHCAVNCPRKHLLYSDKYRRKVFFFSAVAAPA